MLLGMQISAPDKWGRDKYFAYDHFESTAWTVALPLPLPSHTHTTHARTHAHWYYCLFVAWQFSIFKDFRYCELASPLMWFLVNDIPVRSCKVSISITLAIFLLSEGLYFQIIVMFIQFSAVQLKSKEPYISTYQRSNLWIIKANIVHVFKYPTYELNTHRHIKPYIKILHELYAR